MEFSPERIQELVDTYAIPWAKDIAIALLIFIIGRIVVGAVVSTFVKLMGKSKYDPCLLYTSPSPRDLSTSRMPSSA